MILLTVSYTYCCDGAQCPNCTLYLFDEKNNTLIKAIQEMSCKQEIFSWTVRNVLTIGQHTFKVNFSCHE